MISEKFKELIENRKIQIEKLRKEGKKIIGYLCSRFPVELAYALDFIPIRILIVDSLYESLGSEYIWERMCPYAKLIIGNFVARDTFYSKNVDVISGTIICQVIHRILDVLSAYTQKTTLMLTYPLIRPPQKDQENFFVSEIHWFKSELEKIAGKKLSEKELEKAVNTYNEVRKNLKDIYKLYVEGKLKISYKDYFKLVQLSQFLDPIEFITLAKEIKTKQLLEDLPTKSSSEVKIFISGSVVLPENETIFDIIERAGGKIVGEDTCSGLRSFYDINIKEPTISEIARAYLNAVPCGATQCVNLDEDERFRFVTTLIDRYRANGIIYQTLRFCDPYSFKVSETQKFLDKKRKIAFLPIHMDISFSETQRIQTRIEAFIESISFKIGGINARRKVSN